MVSEGKVESIGEKASDALRVMINEWQSRVSGQLHEQHKMLWQTSIEIARRMLQNVDSNLRVSSDDVIELRASIGFCAANHLEQEKKIADMLKIKWPPNEMDDREVLINKRSV